jgi:hypothetical protein
MKEDKIWKLGNLIFVNIDLDMLDIMHILLILGHVLLTPYTKVEETF